MPQARPAKNPRTFAVIGLIAALGVLTAALLVGVFAWYFETPDVNTHGFVDVPGSPYEKDPARRLIYLPDGRYRLVDADYDSFQPIRYDYWYARDRGHMFCKAGRLGDMNPADFAKAPPLGDAGPPGIAGSMFALDSRNVYYCADPLPEADPVTFRYLADGRDYGVDSRHAYYQSTLLQGADRASFQAVDPSWADRSSGFGGSEDFAKDNRTLYHHDAPVTGSYDAMTLRAAFAKGTDFYDKDALYSYDVRKGELRVMEKLPDTQADRRIVPMDAKGLDAPLYRDAGHVYLRWEGYRSVRTGNGRNTSRTAVSVLHLVRLEGVDPDDVDIVSPTQLRQKSPPYDTFFVRERPRHVGTRVGNCRSGLTLLRVGGGSPTLQEALKRGIDIAVDSPAWKFEKCDNRGFLQALGNKLRHPFDAEWPAL